MRYNNRVTLVYQGQKHYDPDQGRTVSTEAKNTVAACVAHPSLSTIKALGGLITTSTIVVHTPTVHDKPNFVEYGTKRYAVTTANGRMIYADEAKQ